jgi:diguanylate cyclase (GGDEF)-like protein
MGRGNDTKTRTIVRQLTELTKKLRKISNLEAALSHICETALHMFPAEGVSIRLLDESRENLLAAARAGESVHRNPLARFRRGEGIVGLVAEKAMTVRVNDTKRDRRFAQREDQRRDIRSVVCAPLVSSAEVFGVLGITHMEPNAFSEEDEHLLELLANCAAPSVEVARLERISLTDPLTLAFNRRYLDRRLSEEIKRSRRFDRPLCLAVIDLDHFKKINDTHGHHCGDALLRETVFIFRTNVREHDIVVRTGGDEFMLLMPDTVLRAAKNALGRLAKIVGGRDIVIDEEEGLCARMTMSMGVSQLRKKDSAKSLIDRADAAMYRAKKAGRNRILS